MKRNIDLPRYRAFHCLVAKTGLCTSLDQPHIGDNICLVSSLEIKSIFGISRRNSNAANPELKVFLIYSSNICFSLCCLCLSNLSVLFSFIRFFLPVAR
mmetsp:Transcript_7763/g.9029  ORF Transcript_7763/g.9029 Transcript_7763/m.9029 type:complete len:99 (-) Transcript_7763:14-310(-)